MLDASSIFTIDHIARAKRLPLPPPLPYSPDSVPFKRHLELLQVALSSHPDESWTVYEALHPSLKVHVPDGLHLSLIRHQLESEDDGWDRVKELVRFAEECGLRREQLGSELIQRIMTFGVNRGLAIERHVDQHMDKEFLGELWETLVNLHGGDISRITPTLTESWIELLYRAAIVPQRLALSPKDRPFFVNQACDIIQSLAYQNKANPYAGMAQKLLLLKERETDVPVENVRRLATLLSYGVKFDQWAVRRILGRARAVMDESERNDGWFDDMSSEIAWIVAGPQAIPTRDLLANVMGWIRKRNPTAAEVGEREMSRVRALIARHDASTPDIIRRALRLLHYFHADETKRTPQYRPAHAVVETVESMTLVLTLFERVAHRPFADCHVLVAAIVRKLLDLRYAGEPSQPEMVVRFANALFSADLFSHIDPHLVHLTFDLLADALGRCDDAYPLARRVYSRARASDPPYSWRQAWSSRERWKKLFNQSLLPQHGHIHFASRLYTDLLADGRRLDAADMSTLIRAVGSLPSRSKYQLLERYMRDYLFFEQGSRVKFVEALVTGLTARGRPREAWLAFHLSKRILGDAVVPDFVYLKTLDVLSRSSRISDIRRAIEVLEYVEKDHASSSQLYYLVFRGISLPGSRYSTDKGRHDIIAVTAEVYKHMVSRGVKTGFGHVESVVRIFLNADEITRALRIVIRAANEEDPWSADLIKRTMVLLGRKGLYDQALLLYDRFRDTPVFLAHSTALKIGKAYVLLIQGQLGYEQILAEVDNEEAVEEAKKWIRKTRHSKVEQKAMEPAELRSDTVDDRLYDQDKEIISRLNLGKQVDGNGPDDRSADGLRSMEREDAEGLVRAKG